MGMLAGVSVLLAGAAFWTYSVLKRSTQATSPETPLQSTTTTKPEALPHDEHPASGGAGMSNEHDEPPANDATNRVTLKPPKEEPTEESRLALAAKLESGEIDISEFLSS